MANKTISADGTIWTGTSKQDKVYIYYADNVKINTGKGNDIIKNNYDYAWYSTIDAGDGNDTIAFEGISGSSINAGAGNDLIRLSDGDDLTINAGAGNDLISLSSGFGLTIKGGTGNDTVSLDSYNNVIQYANGDGNDLIYNLGSTDTISITGAKYTKKNSGNDVILTVGKGKITLKGAKGKSFTIKGTLDGGGKSINNSTKKKLLTGTSYADTIKNSGNNVTINGGKGNDQIDNTNGARSSINAGDGNDIIHHISYDKKGHYITILGGAGNDLISNEYGNNSSIDAGAGNDSIYNRSFYTTILGGAGKDTVYNYNGAWALINTGDGDDSIHNLNAYDDDGYYVTISSGAGNDKISNEYANNASIDAGAGNDSIYNRSYQTTINGGADNDTIRNFNGASSSINGGAGNDLIVNDGDTDYSSVKTTITGGKGNDSISLSGAVSNTVIQYANGDGKDVIYNLGATDTLVISGSTYTKKNSGKDVIVTVGKGKITLKGAKGKTLNINGTLKGGASTLSIPTDAYKYNGHSYKLFNDGKTWEQAKTYCENLGGHLVTITDSGEQNFIENLLARGSKNAYWLGGFKNSKNVWQWTTGEKFSYQNWSPIEPNNHNGVENALMIYKGQNPITGDSLGYWNDIGSNGDCYDDYGNYETFFGKNNFGFICEWDTVTTGGGTSTVTVPPATVPADTVPSGDVLKGTSGHDNIFNGSKNAGKIIYAYDGNDTIENNANNVYISGGNGNDYIKSLYGSNVTIHGDAGADNITVKSNNALVYGDDGNDNIWAYNEGNFIYGGKGNDYIYTSNNNNGFVSGDDGNDTIQAYKGSHLTLSGGAGNDSLWGGSGDDTLIGGTGDDIFVYRPGGGTDHITDFSGGDMLKILRTTGSEGGTFTSATFSGGNLTLAISGGGSVILDNVKSGQSININGTAYKISGKTLK